MLYNDVVAQEFNDDNVTDPKLSSFITNNRERTPAKLKTVPEKYGYIIKDHPCIHRKLMRDSDIVSAPD